MITINRVNLLKTTRLKDTLSKDGDGHKDHRHSLDHIGSDGCL